MLDRRRQKKKVSEIGSENKKILNSTQVHEGETASVQDRRHRGSANDTGSGTREKERVQDETHTESDSTSEW